MSLPQRPQSCALSPSSVLPPSPIRRRVRRLLAACAVRCRLVASFLPTPPCGGGPIIQKFRCHNSSFTNKKTLPFYRQCGFSRSASISLWGYDSPPLLLGVGFLFLRGRRNGASPLIAKRLSVRKMIFGQLGLAIGAYRDADGVALAHREPIPPRLPPASLGGSVVHVRERGREFQSIIAEACAWQPGRTYRTRGAQQNTPRLRPKYRWKIIFANLPESKGEILRNLYKYKCIEILEGNLMPDHVHMLVST